MHGSFHDFMGPSRYRKAMRSPMWGTIVFGCSTLTLLLLVSPQFACDRKTSDKDLVYVTAYDALRTMNQPSGVFGRRTRSVFCDPRSRELYAQKHIAGAISLPFEDMSLEAKGVLGEDTAVVVYDSDYNDVLAKAASKRLLELGFDRVYTLEGGLKAWEKAGNDVATGVPQAAPELPDKPVQ
ncbi:MAG: rhodanese-like domain-containing protein [Planctomycetes bacterium]|nr:rhodanese-like domain-containing protein [Planctomycetota bacterium]